MATLIKRNARKLLAGGKFTTGYANYSVPGLENKLHVIISLGDYIIRMTYSELDRLATEVEHHKETAKAEGYML